MSESESEHDKFLKRVHLWIAIVGGVITISIGAYNAKNLFFSKKLRDNDELNGGNGHQRFLILVQQSNALRGK